MSGGFQDGNLFETAMLLRCEVKAQKQIIEEFKSGQRYLKLQEDYKRVTNGYIREIKKLKKELADAHAQTVSVRELWSDTCDQVWQEYRTEMARKNEKIREEKGRTARP